MDLPRALAQIRDIHAALDRTAVYRGYRAAPVAASGAIGVIAAAVQPPSLAATDPIGFTTYWIVIALVTVALGSSEIVYNYFVRDDDRARRGTREALGQFLPGLVAGVLITAAIVPERSRARQASAGVLGDLLRARHLRVGAVLPRRRLASALTF